MYDHIYSQSPYGLCLCRCLCVSLSLAAALCPSFYKKIKTSSAPVSNSNVVPTCRIFV